MNESSALIIICYLALIAIGVLWLICLVCIASHIVRKHVLFDRNQDLVCEINWNMKHNAAADDIDALKFELSYVTNTMHYHMRMIAMNIVNTVALVIITLLIIAVTGIGAQKIAQNQMNNYNQQYDTTYSYNDYYGGAKTLNELGNGGY